jgi:hypothetical protein
MFKGFFSPFHFPNADSGGSVSQQHKSSQVDEQDFENRSKVDAPVGLSNQSDPKHGKVL